MGNFTEKQRQIRAKAYSDFKKSLKDSTFDEPVTMYIFRPVAFIFVKLFYKTGITPNAVSFMGIGIGILSSIFLATGMPQNISIAALLYFLAIVADNCDGMLARLTQKGTPMGRIIDGFSDYVVGTAMYIGMLLALNKGSLHVVFFDLTPLWILILSSVSIIAHGVAVDYYRGMFTAFGLGKNEFLEAEDQIFRDKVKILKNRNNHFFEKIIIMLFTIYYGVQHKLAGKKKIYESKPYFDANKKLIMLWFWIGPAAHAFLFFIALLSSHLIIYFAYTIVIANVYMLILLIIQNRTNSKLNYSFESEG